MNSLLKSFVLSNALVFDQLEFHCYVLLHLFRHPFTHIALALEQNYQIFDNTVVYISLYSKFFLLRTFIENLFQPIDIILKDNILMLIELVLILLDFNLMHEFFQLVYLLLEVADIFSFFEVIVVIFDFLQLIFNLFIHDN